MSAEDRKSCFHVNIKIQLETLYTANRLEQFRTHHSYIKSGAKLKNSFLNISFKLQSVLVIFLTGCSYVACFLISESV